LTSREQYSQANPAGPEETAEGATANRSIWRLVRLGLLLGLLVLLAWAGLKAWRVAGAARSLLALQTEAQTLLAGGLAGLDPDAAEALALDARENIVTLHDELGFLRPVAPYLGWVPRLGPSLVAAPHLLDMADAGSEAGALAVGGVKPAMSVVQSPDFGMARLGEVLPILADAAPQLEAAGLALDRYTAARAALAAAVDEAALPWRVRQLLQLSDEWLPLARGGLRLLPHAPALLGADGPRRYLIMAQNEDEIRATGGFLTGAGMLTIENGQIVDLNFRDTYWINDWADKPYDFPPQPYYDYMGLEMLLFRDANFWPDFPTSAQKAMDLYAYGQNTPPFDGAIAIDQEFLRLLVDATGPVPVPGSDQTLNADNLLQTLRQARDLQEGQAVYEWLRDRKAFLAGFAAAIMTKLETDFGSVDPVRLARNMAAAIETRHLTLYMRDPDMAAALAANGWDGRLPQSPPGDFLMVVDTNVGYNKVNLYVERSLDYAVTLGAQPEATLAVHYRHTGPDNGEPCRQGATEEFEQASEYLTLADKCYWNYLRVYAPADSELLDSSRHVVPGETLFTGRTWDGAAQTSREQPGLTTFANFLLLPRAGETTASFRYSLPAAVIEPAEDGALYRLTLFKQPGLRPEPLRLTLTLPDGATLLSATPAPTASDGNRLTFEATLAANFVLSVRYR
jgi:hypothetical protein